MLLSLSLCGAKMMIHEATCWFIQHFFAGFTALLEEHYQ